MRVGRIGYINCYPVYRAIDLGHVQVSADFVTGTPSELNDLLAAGELDLSVISAVEYARNAGEYHLLPDLAISCDGPVRSVAVFSKCPIDALDGKTVLVSASSRTSVLLFDLLCRERWGIRPNVVEVRAEGQDLGALENLPHDAVLVIGDAALLLAARRVYNHQYDLGSEWKEWTGLPFVFAVWAARRDTDLRRVRAIHEQLRSSRDWGLGHLPQLAAEAADVTSIGVDTCLEYLGGLDYGLSDHHIAGLTEFFDRLARQGIVRQGYLSFLSVA